MFYIEGEIKCPFYERMKRNNKEFTAYHERNEVFIKADNLRDVHTYIRLTCCDNYELCQYYQQLCEKYEKGLIDYESTL